MQIRVNDLTKTYGLTTALNHCSLAIEEGAFTAIIGKSGSGKSTLLKMIAGLEQPDSGTVRVADIDISGLSEEEAALFRADHIGFVFQFFALVSVCTIRENLALVLDSHSSAGDQAWQQEVISRMGIEPWLDKYPHELSGGQQQRAAIAVAMIRKPDVILADEPTGNLDRQSGMDVMRLLKMCQSQLGMTVVMVTHDLDLAKQADRIIELTDGRPWPYEAPGTLD
ncbi:ABC transporter ATP-binding protein [uncultured Faecalibaculum sp.]|uniref:ABC transporter ATP-binding protein n=1 Tax=uncultured Faecalibaculum sp. TaxID=1729681 RepID=UPI0025D39E06|nr:ABC transporter ATP-binding protein [uncultured Faecalibaculum sp.]